LELAMRPSWALHQVQARLRTCSTAIRLPSIPKAMTRATLQPDQQSRHQQHPQPLARSAALRQAQRRSWMSLPALSWRSMSQKPQEWPPEPLGRSPYRESRRLRHRQQESMFLVAHSWMKPPNQPQPAPERALRRPKRAQPRN
jgi:hypothetical protein